MNMDRRHFIPFAAMATAGILNEACKPQATPQSRNEASAPTRAVPSPEASPIPEDPKVLVLKELTSLPDSHIKTALQDRVAPFMRTPTPALVLSGVDLPISTVTVSENITQYATDKSSIHATYARRGKAAANIYKPIADTTIVFPLVHLLRPNEVSLIPAASLLPDGTPFAKIPWTPQTPIDKNLAPEIILNITVQGTTLSPTALNNLRTFGYIKEACTFLLDQLYMEATIKKMQKYNLPTHVTATDNTGVITSVPIIAEGALNIFRSNGRSKAIMDLAGYVAGIKALAKSPAYQLLVQSGAIDATLGNKIIAADLGTTPEDILTKSYEWVLNNPEVTKFTHQGDINQLP